MSDIFQNKALSRDEIKAMYAAFKKQLEQQAFQAHCSRVIGDLKDDAQERKLREQIDKLAADEAEWEAEDAAP